MRVRITIELEIDAEAYGQEARGESTISDMLGDLKQHASYTLRSHFPITQLSTTATNQESEERL